MENILVTKKKSKAYYSKAKHNILWVLAKKYMELILREKERYFRQMEKRKVSTCSNKWKALGV